MAEKVNPWKANLTNGLILGLAGVVFTLVTYFMDLTLNKNVGYIFLLISVFLLYYFIKSYRDNYLHGFITYGQSVGTGVIIFFYYSLISVIFMYLLYKVIDPGLIDKMLAMTEEQLVKSGKIPEASIEAAMSMQRKIMTPEIIAPITLFTSMLFGTIISLIVSIFTKKEGNPLLEPAEN